MLKPTIHDTYLSHYGVKGMKWGVLKARRDGKIDARRKISASKSPRRSNIQRARGTRDAFDKKNMKNLSIEMIMRRGDKKNSEGR